jgi:hypothetical protein
MSEAKKTILDFAHSLEMPRRGRKPTLKIAPSSARELRVPLNRMSDLMSLEAAIHRGMIRGQISYLNRKAKCGELKAIKIAGLRGWQVLPEWCEDYNNRWTSHRHDR